jgi:hypothetical protein
MLGLSGLGTIQGGMAAFERAASAVSGAANRATSDDASVPASDVSDLTDAMVGMNLATHAVRAGVAVIRANDEMLGTMLDIYA